MLVKILIRRRFKPGNEKQIYALLRQFRAGAMDLQGYVSGVTFRGYEDPQELMVISTWQSMEDWQRWRDNPVRLRFEAMLEIYQEGPTQYEFFVLGALADEH